MEKEKSTFEDLTRQLNLSSMDIGLLLEKNGFIRYLKGKEKIANE